MTGKKFFKTLIIMLLMTILIIGGIVFTVDPFFHYRAPNSNLYYIIYDQRSQNDGITRHFTYDSIITGTSMAENFKTSLFDELMGTDSIKVCYSGATYKEIDDNLAVSYDSGHSLKYVLRPLDYSLLDRDKDALRDDMGEYPYWLTNSNPFDDVKYLLNRDVLINYTIPAIVSFFNGHEGGHTSFDEYSLIQDCSVFGKENVLWAVSDFNVVPDQMEASETELQIVKGNIEQNVIRLAQAHPETTFLYFFPPYSMAYWGGLRSEGKLSQMLKYKKTAIEMMLKYDNIHVYSFSLYTDITSDLNNYRDVAHYSPKINDYITESIAESENTASLADCRITKENYAQYCQKEAELFNEYDYDSLLK